MTLDGNDTSRCLVPKPVGTLQLLLGGHAAAFPHQRPPGIWPLFLAIERRLSGVASGEVSNRVRPIKDQDVEELLFVPS